MKIRVLFVLILSSCVNTTYALNKQKVKDGSTVRVTISQDELTQIKVSGKANKIVDIWNSNDSLFVNTDEESGAIYIKPKPMTKRMFSFFIKDDTNSVYSIVAKKENIPSEIIELVNVKTPVNYNYNKGYLSNTYQSSIKKIIKDAVNNNFNSSNVVNHNSENINLYQELDIKKYLSLQNRNLICTKYGIKNVSDETMILSMDVFFDFGKGVKAVALEHKKLEVGESTFLYVVRGDE